MAAPKTKVKMFKRRLNGLSKLEGDVNDWIDATQEAGFSIIDVKSCVIPWAFYTILVLIIYRDIE